MSFKCRSYPQVLRKLSSVPHDQKKPKMLPLKLGKNFLNRKLEKPKIEWENVVSAKD